MTKPRPVTRPSPPAVAEEPRRLPIRDAPVVRYERLGAVAGVAFGAEPADDGSQHVLFASSAAWLGVSLTLILLGLLAPSLAAPGGWRQEILLRRGQLGWVGIAMFGAFVLGISVAALAG